MHSLIKKITINLIALAFFTGAQLGAMEPAPSKRDPETEKLVFQVVDLLNGYDPDDIYQTDAPPRDPEIVKRIFEIVTLKNNSQPYEEFDPKVVKLVFEVVNLQGGSDCPPETVTDVCAIVCILELFDSLTKPYNPETVTLVHEVVNLLKSQTVSADLPALEESRKILRKVFDDLSNRLDWFDSEKVKHFIELLIFMDNFDCVEQSPIAYLKRQKQQVYINLQVLNSPEMSHKAISYDQFIYEYYKIVVNLNLKFVQENCLNQEGLFIHYLPKVIWDKVNKEIDSDMEKIFKKLRSEFVGILSERQLKSLREELKRIAVMPLKIRFRRLLRFYPVLEKRFPTFQDFWLYDSHN